MGLDIHGRGGWAEQGADFYAFENKNLLPPPRFEPQHLGLQAISLDNIYRHYTLRLIQYMLQHCVQCTRRMRQFFPTQLQIYILFLVERLVGLLY